MIKKLKLLPIILSLSIFSCTNIQNTTMPSINTLFSKKLSIFGEVNFSEKFSIKANANQAGKNATISILYPKNHPTFPNKTIATGLTNNTGRFTLNSDFLTNTGDIFVLEAIKRVGEFGNKHITIRTFIKKTDSGWESITKDAVQINAYTTTLTIIADKYFTPYNNLMNKLELYSDNTAKSMEISGIAAETIKNVFDMVQQSLFEDKDPITFVRYFNSNWEVNKNFEKGTAFLNGEETVAPKAISCNECTMSTYDLNKVNLVSGNLKGADFSRMNFETQDFTEVA